MDKNNLDPGSAVHRCALHRVRGTSPCHYFSASARSFAPFSGAFLITEAQPTA